MTRTCTKVHKLVISLSGISDICIYVLSLPSSFTQSSRGGESMEGVCCCGRGFGRGCGVTIVWVRVGGVAACCPWEVDPVLGARVGCVRRWLRARSCGLSVLGVRESAWSGRGGEGMEGVWGCGRGCGVWVRVGGVAACCPWEMDHVLGAMGGRVRRWLTDSARPCPERRRECAEDRRAKRSRHMSRTRGQQRQRD